MKNQFCQPKTSEASLTSRVQDMEQRNSGLEDEIEEMESLIKQNANSNNFFKKNFHAQNLKRPNTRDRRRKKEPRAKAQRNIFNI